MTKITRLVDTSVKCSLEKQYCIKSEHLVEKKLCGTNKDIFL